MCELWADCSCGESCSCGTSCTCGTVSHEYLSRVKESACKYGDCPCGTKCCCGFACGCGGSAERTEAQWIELAQNSLTAKTGECPWSDCTCKASGGLCECKSECACGTIKA